METVVAAAVVDFPWVLEKPAGDLELEEGGEVLGHDVAQSGLWRGGGQLSVEEPGQRLALEAEGKGSGGLKMVLVKGLEEKVVGLGGEVAPGAWSERTTHVLVNKFSEFPEKVMLGLVCGVWVVTRRYVDNSSHRGAWADVRVGRGQSGM